MGMHSVNYSKHLDIVNIKAVTLKKRLPLILIVEGTFSVPYHIPLGLHDSYIYIASYMLPFSNQILSLIKNISSEKYNAECVHMPCSLCVNSEYLSEDV